MNQNAHKPIYKIVTLFPGLLRPTYSEEEYLSVVAREGSMLTWLFVSLSVLSLTSVFATAFLVIEHLTK